MTTNVIGALDFDADPASWRVRILGWDSAASGDYQAGQRPQSDGSFDDRNDATAKHMTLDASVEVNNPADLEDALDRFKFATSRSDTILARTKYGRTLHMTVKRLGEVAITRYGSEQAARLSAELIAIDPFKYGDALPLTTGLPAPGAGGLVFPLFQTTGKLEFGAPGTSGQVTLLNPGTAPAYPTFTITGPVLGGVVLTDVASGRRIVYAGDVPAGATLLIIDTATGTATLNGADRTGDLTSKQWWAIAARGSSTVQFATLGAGGQAGQLSALVYPTYE